MKITAGPGPAIRLTWRIALAAALVTALGAGLVTTIISAVR
jgi:hypothetical protein